MAIKMTTVPILLFVAALLVSVVTAQTHAQDQTQVSTQREVVIEGDGETTLEVCQDNHESCSHWKSTGECRSNPEYMKLNCRKSCGLCGCTDEDDRCPHLAYHNHCVGKDETYMMLKCRKSCESCGMEGQELKDHIEYRRRLAAVGGDVKLLETKYGYQQVVAGVEGHPQETLEKILKETQEYMENTVLPEDAHVKYKKIQDKCFNRQASCTYWKATGACDTNRAFMRQNCAPTCQICEELDFEFWCPIDETKPMAVPNPGDLDKMFQRILDTPEFKQYSPRAVSMPNPQPNSTIPVGPWLIEFDTFLTDEECTKLIDWGTKIGYKQSVDTGNQRVDGSHEMITTTWRTSSTAWCSTECYQDTKDIHDRIETVTGIPISNAEHLQLLEYNVGEYYKYHHDATPFHWERQQGPRVVTFFLYLNTVLEGGGTDFPDINITVTPKRGKAVLWPNLLNDDPMKMDRRTAHQALPVLEGNKYGANVWIHQRDFKETYSRNCV